MVNLLQITDNIQKLVDTAFDASPLNTLGYGIALVILILMSVLFHSNWKQERKYNKERAKEDANFHEKMLTIMELIKIRLQDQQSFTEKLDDISDACNTLLELAKTPK